MKRLIVNADDFGHSASVNAGVVEAFERGIVRSASFMVRRPGAPGAAAYARSQPGLDVGLHVELGEWVFVDGAWGSADEVPAEDVESETRAQLEAFRGVMQRDPTHLDSHQHVHRREPARSVLQRVAAELAVPLRHFSPDVTYCGDFYGQTDEGEPLPDAITVDSLIGIVRRLKADTTELCCHPGRGDVPGSSYASERCRELEALCDPRVREAIEELGISLGTFREVA